MRRASARMVREQSGEELTAMNHYEVIAIFNIVDFTQLPINSVIERQAGTGP